MFSKTAKTPEPIKAPEQPLPPMKIDAAPPVESAPPSGQVAAQARKPKVATLIAENMTIEGGISGEGELHVDGVVRGDVRVGRLTIGDTGHIEGSVVCESVEIRGRVVGTVTSKQVRLYGTAFMEGDITHEQLAMEVGAYFQGRSLKFQRPAGADKAPAQPAAPAHAAKDGPVIDAASKVVN